MNFDLQKREVGGGRVKVLSEGSMDLDLPPIASETYGLAQVDDYMHLPRGQFPHCPPLSLELDARASAHELPGTWGFGFWNDPYMPLFGVLRQCPMAAT